MTPANPLRVWPGIVAVALQWLARFGIKAFIPGIKGFGRGMMVSFVFTIALIVWWAFFSRASRKERFGGLGLIVAALGATWLFRHDSMWLPWLLAYAIPFLSLAFVIWAVATRGLPDRIRHATMVATILIACGAWLFVRQNGINGDHQAEFGWRWSKSPEERLLAETVNEPAQVPTSATPATTAATPTASPSPSASPKAPAAPAETRAEWPGFRGPRRDGVVRGVRIDTYWSAKPPVQFWRHPGGRGWSSFAVRG